MNPFRIEPKLPPQAMKTYQIVAPKQTHFRTATCKEVDCPNYLNGWRTLVDTSTELGQRQAYYIEKLSGRSYKKQEDGSYLFAAGQQCFQEHRVRLEDVPDIYIVKDGDHRRSDNVRRHANAADWVDDFQNHQDKLRTQIERG